MPTRRSAERLALAIEAELDDHPDERGVILLDAGEAWREAGHHDRAVELFTEAVALGGDEGGYARVELALTML